MRGAVERCVGNAGELASEFGGNGDVARQSPEAGMHACNQRADQSNETHQSDRMGLKTSGDNPSPEWAIAATQPFLL
jgi:hypothetical protein